jgi:hypothetical protein
MHDGNNARIALIAARSFRRDVRAVLDHIGANMHVDLMFRTATRHAQN